jgi:DNA repair protein RadA/Sms
MATKNYNYICQNCGATYNKWAGKCNDCNSWNTIELQESNTQYSPTKTAGTQVDFVTLSDHTEKQTRVESTIGELDRVLGGGLVPGSAILIGGDPGIGKSTLLLQLTTRLTANNINCAYVSGEESIEQIRIHVSRLELANSPVKILSTTNINDIIATIEKEKEKIELIVIDSIQTVFIPDIPSAPGTVSQVRASAHELVSLAKRKGIIIVIVGHVTKDGQIAGPKLLEHMVDTVLYFEGEKGNNFRILRAVKNRFGSINEIGIFEMSEQGLVEINNPSSLFLAERKNNISGSTIFASVEGTRPVLVEIQALVSPSHMVAPRRAVVGWDLNRLSMMVAVLATRYGLKLNSYEIYLNVVGGLKIIEPAADLAAICSLISAMYNKALEKDTIVCGEVGLSGEIRRVSNINARLKEATNLGFKNAIIPAGSKLSKDLKDLNITEISHIKQLQSFFVTKVGA